MSADRDRMVTTSDLDRVEERLAERFDNGLASVHGALDNIREFQRVESQRLAVIEARLNDDATGLGAQRQRVTNLEREVFGEQGARVSAVVATSSQPADLTISLTPRMWKIVVAVVGALATFAPPLGEWLLRMAGALFAAVNP